MREECFAHEAFQSWIVNTVPDSSLGRTKQAEEDVSRQATLWDRIFISFLREETQKS